MPQSSICDVLGAVRIKATFTAWANLRMELPSVEVEMVWEKVLGAVLSPEVWYLGRRCQIGRWINKSGGD